MSVLRNTVIAAALALTAGAAQALPQFNPGGNSLAFQLYDNQYRPAANCTVANPCLAADPTNDPAGFQRVDNSVAGNILVGDIFAGIVNVLAIQHLNDFTFWNSTPTDQFTGYIAQQVTAITPYAPNPSLNKVDFVAPTTDPFGVLGAGQMGKFFVDSTTPFVVGPTTFGSLSKATDGTPWGAIGTTGNYNPYAYTLDNPLLSGAAQFTDKTYLAANIVAQLAGYNAPQLDKVNDPSESSVGGITAGNQLICSAADIAAGRSCTDLAGNADIKLNGSGPWQYITNDPLSLAALPEPGSIALVGLGLVALGALRRRRAI